jgi:phenylacetic acid degradation operon negative regulatory protein
MTTRRPQDLVFTLYGEFLLRRAEPVRVGSLIALLEPLGLTAGGVRTVLSRMMAKGWLCGERHRGRGYYALSERGRRLLEEGEARIYRPARLADWDGAWTLLAYSIPEEQRRQRDRLRSQLSWLGFGSLGNGLWISPHDMVARVRAVGEELGVLSHLEVFRSMHAGFSDRRRLVSQCWDLPAINVRYEAFIARHLAAHQALQAAPASVAGRNAYERRFALVHEYREFPQLDPFLPRPLQPQDWAGECALALFQSYHALLSPASDAYLREVLETLPRRRGAAAR